MLVGLAEETQWDEVILQISPPEDAVFLLFPDWEIFPGRPTDSCSGRAAVFFPLGLAT